MPKTRTSKTSTKNVRTDVAAKVAHASVTATPAATREDVAARAFGFYLEEGCPEGRHLDHWARAERELGFVG